MTTHKQTVSIARVYLQGAVDRLSGIYAVINALSQLGWFGGLDDEADAKRVFNACCRALPKRSWPSVVWEGIPLADLRKMLSRIADVLPEFPKVVEPFTNRKFRYHAVFWDKLIAHLSQEEIGYAVIQLRQPIDHWLLVQHDPRGLRVFDSNPHLPQSTYVLDAHRVSSGSTVAGTSLLYLDRQAVLLFPKIGGRFSDERRSAIEQSFVANGSHDQ